jgi:hypothetical protein
VSRSWSLSRAEGKETLYHTHVAPPPYNGILAAGVFERKIYLSVSQPLAKDLSQVSVVKNRFFTFLFKKRFVQENGFTNGLGGAGLFRASSFFAFRPIGSSWAYAVRGPAGLLCPVDCTAEEGPRGRERGVLSLLELYGSPLFVFEIDAIQ